MKGSFECLFFVGEQKLYTMMNSSFCTWIVNSEDKDSTTIASIQGDIKHSDGLKFTKIAESWRKLGAPIQIVMLDSPGGVVLDGFQIGYYIAKHRIATIVPNHALCASSCVNIFLAGKPRIADELSQIGVHRASQNSFDTNRARGISIDINNYYKSMNTPDSIRLAMLDTPPHQMYYLTSADKKAISTYQLDYQSANRVFEESNVVIPNQKMNDYSNAQINLTASLKLTPKRGGNLG